MTAILFDATRKAQPRKKARRFGHGLTNDPPPRSRAFEPTREDRVWAAAEFSTTRRSSPRPIATVGDLYNAIIPMLAKIGLEPEAGSLDESGFDIRLANGRLLRIAIDDIDRRVDELYADRFGEIADACLAWTDYDQSRVTAVG